MQSLPLEAKIIMTQRRIREWYEHWDGQVYVSFSGGKDSTVLLHLVRELYPDVPAVFVDTGLEYPEIREFVKKFDSVQWLYPLEFNKKERAWQKTNFKDVIFEYGFPVVSKEVSRQIHDVQTIGKNCWAYKCLTTDRGQFDMRRWNYLIDAPFRISNKCCDIMKKAPVHRYGIETGNKPIIGTLACESKQRKVQWIKQGCNAFDGKTPISKPLSFWTKQNILQYITTNNLKIAPVYGEIMSDKHGKFTLTGAQRTGCMFCMFGVHLEKEPNRFQRMKVTHPKQYDYCIRPVEENGLGLGKVLDYIGVKY